MTKSMKNLDGLFPEKKEIIKLGELVFTKQPEKYNLLGLGTCLGIYLYDLTKETYMIAHTLLPQYCSNHKKIDPDNLARFTDLALRLMVKRLVKHGSAMDDIKAKIVGGGKIYNDALEIGENNIKCARRLLEELNIPIVAEDVGGTSSKSVLDFNRDGKLHMRKQGKYYYI